MNYTCVFTVLGDDSSNYVYVLSNVRLLRHDLQGTGRKLSWPNLSCGNLQVNSTPCTPWRYMGECTRWEWEVGFKFLAALPFGEYRQVLKDEEAQWNPQTLWGGDLTISISGKWLEPRTIHCEWREFDPLDREVPPFQV